MRKSKIEQAADLLGDAYTPCKNTLLLISEQWTATGGGNALVSLCSGTGPFEGHDKDCPYGIFLRIRELAKEEEKSSRFPFRALETVRIAARIPSALKEPVPAQYEAYSAAAWKTITTRKAPVAMPDRTATVQMIDDIPGSNCAEWKCTVCNNTWASPSLRPCPTCPPPNPFTEPKADKLEGVEYVSQVDEGRSAGWFCKNCGMTWISPKVAPCPRCHANIYAYFSTNTPGAIEAITNTDTPILLDGTTAYFQFATPDFWQEVLLNPAVSIRKIDTPAPPAPLTAEQAKAVYESVHTPGIDRFAWVTLYRPEAATLKTPDDRGGIFLADGTELYLMAENRTVSNHDSPDPLEWEAVIRSGPYRCQIVTVPGNKIRHIYKESLPTAWQFYEIAFRTCKEIYEKHYPPALNEGKQFQPVETPFRVTTTTVQDGIVPAGTNLYVFAIAWNENVQYFRGVIYTGPYFGQIIGCLASHTQPITAPDPTGEIPLDAQSCLNIYPVVFEHHTGAMFQPLDPPLPARLINDEVRPSAGTGKENTYPKGTLLYLMAFGGGVYRAIVRSGPYSCGGLTINKLCVQLFNPEKETN